MPLHYFLLSRSLIRPYLCVYLAAAGAAGLLGGCARTPASALTASSRQLDIRMTVAGTINPNDYYFVVFNNSNDSNGGSGPVPVIAEPWGNGFVAGSATSFMEYTGSQPGDGYLFYDFGASSVALQNFNAVGAPVQDTPVTGSSNTLEFRIPLSYLDTSSIAASPTSSQTSTNSIQVNFIACDSLPVNSQDPSAEHEFDALGNALTGQVNRYITVSTVQNTTYSNSTAGSLEPSGDVAACRGGGALVAATDSNAPNLDITDWSVTITGS